MRKDFGLKKTFGCPECDYKMSTFFIYNAKSEESDKNRPHVVSNKSKPKSFFRLYHDKYVNVQSVITISPKCFIIYHAITEELVKINHIRGAILFKYFIYL